MTWSCGADPTEDKGWVVQEEPASTDEPSEVDPSSDDPDDVAPTPDGEPEDAPPETDRPPQEEQPPPVEEPVVAYPGEGEVVGTRWGSTLEGSLGRYITWRGFPESGVLDVVEQVDRYNEGELEERWTSLGEWSLERGIVSMAWTRADYDTQYEVRRTWAVVSGEVATAVQPHLPGVVREGVDLWVAGGLWRSEDGAYRGVFERVNSANSENEVRQTVDVEVELSLEPCELDVEIVAHYLRAGDEPELADEPFEFECETRPLGDTGWSELVVDGFEGDEVATPWRELVEERNLWDQGYHLDRLFAHFQPRLYLAPDGDLLVHRSGTEALFDSYERSSTP